MTCIQCGEPKEPWRKRRNLCAFCARKQTTYDYNSRGATGRRQRPCSRCRTPGHYASTCTVNR